VFCDKTDIDAVKNRQTAAKDTLWFRLIFN